MLILSQKYRLKTTASPYLECKCAYARSRVILCLLFFRKEKEQKNRRDAWECARRSETERPIVGSNWFETLHACFTEVQAASYTPPPPFARECWCNIRNNVSSSKVARIARVCADIVICGTLVFANCKSSFSSAGKSRLEKKKRKKRKRKKGPHGILCTSHANLPNSSRTCNTQMYSRDSFVLIARLLHLLRNFPPFVSISSDHQRKMRTLDEAPALDTQQFRPRKQVSRVNIPFENILNKRRTQQTLSALFGIRRLEQLATLQRDSVVRGNNSLREAPGERSIASLLAH